MRDQTFQVTDRSFYMGMSDWTCGPTEIDHENTLEQIRLHGDLICFQFDDGVPWPEAYASSSYGEDLREKILGRKLRLTKDQKIYLEIGALDAERSHITGYWADTGGQPRPAPWDSLAIDDPKMIIAYANYCNDLIAQFQPTFVNYSLKCTDFLLNAPND